MPLKDLQPFVNILVDHAKKELGDDLELVIHYGSRAKDYAEPGSDYDVSYVPAQGKNIWKNWQCLIDDICIDFYPMQWEGLEANANFDVDRTSVIVESRVLYHKSEEVLKRFQALQDRVSELQTPEKKGEMLAKAIRRFTETVYHLATLEHMCAEEDLRSWRKEAMAIADGIVHCLTVLNQTYFPKAWVRCIDKVAALPTCPQGIDRMLTTLAVDRSYENVRQAAIELVRQTRRLLVEEQRAGAKKREAGWKWINYPEWRAMCTKTLRACDSGNLVEANAAAMVYLSETALARAGYQEGVDYTSFNVVAEYSKSYDALRFPDIASCETQDEFAEFRRKLSAHDEQLKQLLVSEGLDLLSVTTEEDLKRSLLTHG
ncbi:MAG: hypothetical protein AAB152_15550 [Candidatus Coatesbacteria bacterium]